MDFFAVAVRCAIGTAVFRILCGLGEGDHFIGDDLHPFLADF